METFRTLAINELSDSFIRRHKDLIDTRKDLFGATLQGTKMDNVYVQTGGNTWPMDAINKSYTRVSLSRAVVDFWISNEQTVYMQVIKMDEQFRAADATNTYEFAGYRVVSDDRPDLERTKIKLRGRLKQHDDNITSCRYLSSASAQCAIADCITVLKHWSKHWWAEQGKSGEIKLVNCTGHPIKAQKYKTNIIEVIPASGDEARVESSRDTEIINGFLCSAYHTPVIRDLPDPVEGVLYIVSTLVMQNSDREDLISPNTGTGAVKDGAGKIQYIRKFQRKKVIRPEADGGSDESEIQES